MLCNLKCESASNEGSKITKDILKIYKILWLWFLCFSIDYLFRSALQTLSGLLIVFAFRLDSCHTLTCALMLLNTDLHTQVVFIIDIIYYSLFYELP